MSSRLHGIHEMRLQHLEGLNQTVKQADKSSKNWRSLGQRFSLNVGGMFPSPFSRTRETEKTQYDASASKLKENESSAHRIRRPFKRYSSTPRRVSVANPFQTLPTTNIFSDNEPPKDNREIKPKTLFADSTSQDANVANHVNDENTHISLEKVVAKYDKLYINKATTGAKTCKTHDRKSLSTPRRVLAEGGRAESPIESSDNLGKDENAKPLFKKSVQIAMNEEERFNDIMNAAKPPVTPLKDKLKTPRPSLTPQRGQRSRNRVSVRELRALQLNDTSLGSTTVFSPVRTSRKQERDLGTKSIVTPARRSRRKSVRSRIPPMPPTTTMLEDAGYAYTPNRNIPEKNLEEEFEKIGH